MNEMEMMLTTFVSQAKDAIKNEQDDVASERLVNAQKCALLLAKKFEGSAREKYLASAKSLKALYEQVLAKSASVKNTPTAPTAPTAAPSAPVTGGAPQKDSAGSSAPARASGNEGGAYVPPKRNDALSPLYLSDYIGQPGAVMAVRDLITAARLKNAAMPHLIVYGSHGLGKTTFAKIIANEMRAKFTEINVSKINPAEMIAILKKLQPKEILFIDEIHTLPLLVAESILYSAMQDGRITYTVGKGQFAKTETLELPPFTLIGATTEIGKLAKPFTQRAIQVRLEEYTDEVLSGIISGSFYKLGVKITPERALVIAKRCRNNPRVANSMVKRISDKALVRYAKINNLETFGAFDSVDAIRKLGIEVSDQVIAEFFKENGIDEHGLENGDRELLRMIIHRYHGGPVGIDTLARAMNESNNVLAQKYEAYLIKKGMLRVDRDGRVAMAAAYEALGLPVPPEKRGEQAGEKEPAATEEKKSKYDKRTVIVSHVAEELKCKKVEDLIVYPSNVRTVSESLDELFPDVEKPYEAETRHLCELELDFDTHKRILICDSFLESRFATMMASVGFLHDIKAQTLEIPYISQELANRRYFPDFVVKDNKDRIAVIEMKNFDMLSYHLNIDKYEHLMRYCEQKGYGYAEVAKEYDADTYVSVEMLKSAPVDRELEQFIIERIEKNGNETGEGMFREKDFADYVAAHGKTDRKKLYTVLLNNRALKNVDRIGNDMKIVMN